VVYEYRAPIDYKFGTLSAPAALSDTTLSSASFSTLLDTYSTGFYVPVVLHDPSIPAHEVVWVTAHAAAATTVTVVRAREGTIARAWPSSTQWLVAPTSRDALITAANDAALPTEPNVGERALLLDQGLVKEKTLNQGWLSAPASAPADIVGSGGANPASRRPVIKAAVLSGTTNGSGQFTVNIPNGGFGVATQVVTAQVANGTMRLVIESYTTTTVTFSVWNNITLVGAGNVVSLHLIAIGY
jgi:hypothetical protein